MSINRELDATDLFGDFDGDQLPALLEQSVQQIEYHRDQLMFWRKMKARLEELLPKSPLDELADIAEDAWTQP